MGAQIFWIDTGSTGRLCILARPRGGDWLTDEVGSWRRAGIEIVVSMLTRLEIDEFELADEAELCKAAGLQFVAMPVLDRGVPQSREQFAAVVDQLTSLINNGKSVGIHCRAGIGRSAMLAAGVLTRMGLSVADAFDRIGRARGCPVPDTAEQCIWVEQSMPQQPAKAV